MKSMHCVVATCPNRGKKAKAVMMAKIETTTVSMIENSKVEDENSKVEDWFPLRQAVWWRSTARYACMRMISLNLRPLRLYLGNLAAAFDDFRGMRGRGWRKCSLALMLLDDQIKKLFANVSLWLTFTRSASFPRIIAFPKVVMLLLESMWVEKWWTTCKLELHFFYIDGATWTSFSPGPSRWCA